MAWDVTGLIEASRGLPVRNVAIAQFEAVLDSVYWFDDVHRPTVRAVTEHARLIEAADLAYPIILGSDGRVMDGMHRICKALHQGRQSILAVQFETDPPADFVGVEPTDLVTEGKVADPAEVHRRRSRE